MDRIDLFAYISSFYETKTVPVPCMFFSIMFSFVSVILHLFLFFLLWLFALALFGLKGKIPAATKKIG